MVKRDLLAFWRYFQPDVANGDAYGVGLLSSLNDELLASGLTDIDRHTVGDGSSTQTNWPDWAFSPLRFEGMQKHQMATALRNLFHSGNAALPYVDDRISEPAAADMHLMQQQLPNIKKVPTSKAYSSYKMANKKLGDDLFDASLAAYWGIWNRVMEPAKTTILLGRKFQRQMLEEVSHG